MATGKDRRHIQGLVAIAAGFLASDESRPRLAGRLLRRGLRRLATAPATLETVDVTIIRSAADMLASALGRGQPASARGLLQLAT